MTKDTLPENWQIFETPQAVADFTVKTLLESAQKAISQREAFHLVTAGGSTPMACYQKLSTLSAKDADWQNWHIYMGDERCLPKQDAERNSLALQQAWLENSEIPSDNIHFMAAEKGAEQAALEYQETLSDIGLFDVVMLGMGEDGHTASLFPGHLHEAGLRVITEYHSPKMPPERVSLSYQCLSDSRMVIKLITGAGKQTAMKQWLDGETLPISQIHAKFDDKQTLVLLDQAAYPQ